MPQPQPVGSHDNDVDADHELPDWAKAYQVIYHHWMPVGLSIPIKWFFILNLGLTLCLSDAAPCAAAEPIQRWLPAPTPA
jgi:hypothetical protein